MALLNTPTLEYRWTHAQLSSYLALYQQRVRENEGHHRARMLSPAFEMHGLTWSISLEMASEPLHPADSAAVEGKSHALGAAELDLLGPLGLLISDDEEEGAARWGSFKGRSATQMSLFLELHPPNVDAGANWGRRVMFSFALPQVGFEALRLDTLSAAFSAAHPRWGFSAFHTCNSDELERAPMFRLQTALQVDVSITLFLPATPSAALDEVAERDPTGDLVARLLHEPHYRDITLEASDGALIRAHRVILASKSPVLDAMLRTPSQEQTSGRIRFSSPFLHEQVLRAVVEFVYLGRLPSAATPPGFGLTLCVDLLQASQFLQMPQLQRVVVHLVGPQITLDNVISLVQRAVQDPFLQQPLPLLSPHPPSAPDQSGLGHSSPDKSGLGHHQPSPGKSGLGHHQPSPDTEGLGKEGRSRARSSGELLLEMATDFLRRRSDDFICALPRLLTAGPDPQIFRVASADLMAQTTPVVPRPLCSPLSPILPAAAVILDGSPIIGAHALGDLGPNAKEPYRAPNWTLVGGKRPMLVPSGADGAAKRQRTQ